MSSGGSTITSAGSVRCARPRLGCLRGELKSSTALCTSILAFTMAFALTAPPALANPQGGQVVAGSAEIVATSATRLEIRQQSERGIINWQSFSIDQAEQTHFAQPSASSVTLNRVVGGDLSTIAGRLTADGNVILSNPNGIFFTETARIDVRGLIATTARISNEDFMAGRYVFTPSGNPDSFVVNRGEITAGEGGLAALVAPWVENAGIINARLGRVTLASGEAFTVDLYGDRLIQLAVTDQGLLGDVVPEAFGGDARISNPGTVIADGGTVALTVGAAKGLVDNVINMDGIIEARSVAERGGRIVLEGGDAGIVRVAGSLDASGRDAGERGGEVEVLGRMVGLFGGGDIDVSGDLGGGTALVGGNYQGNGPEANAWRTYVADSASIRADAVSAGDGGRVIVWADDSTRYYGSISARGGARSGDGGFVEVSGKRALEFRGDVALGADNGAGGMLLLDPLTITISDSDTNNAPQADIAFGDSPDDVTITEGTLENTLSGDNATIVLQARNEITIADLTDDELTLQSGVSVVFQTRNDTASGDSATGGFSMESDNRIVAGGAGSITIQTGVTASADGTVTARGQGNADVAIGKLSAANGAVTVEASGTITVNGDVTTQASVSMTATGVTNKADISGAAGVTIVGDDIDLQGGSTIAASAGDVTLRASDGRAIRLLDAAKADVAGSLNLSDSEIETVTASGTITVGHDVAGDVTFDTFQLSSGSLTVRTGGKIDDVDDLNVHAGTATNDSLVFIAGDAIGSANAEGLNVQAGSVTVDASGGKDVTITSGSTLATSYSVTTGGGGDVTLVQDTKNIRVGVVTTTGNVSLEAKDGSIVDAESGNEATTDVAGNAVTLKAKTGIGSADNRLDLAAATLDATTTGAGDIYLNEADGITLGSAAAIATGADDRAIDILAGGAVVVAKDVTVTGTGTLTLKGSGITVNTDTDVTTEGGKLTVDAGTDTLTLSDAASTFSTLDTTSSGGNGDIELTAGDFVIGSADTNDQIIAGSGAVTLTVASGSTINIGNPAAGANDLTDAELAEITTSGALTIGSASAGAMTITSADFNTVGASALTLRSGSSIRAHDNGAAADLTFGGDLTLIGAGIGDGSKRLDLDHTAAANRTLTVTAASGDVDIKALKDLYDAVSVTLSDANSGVAIDLSGGDSIAATGSDDTNTITTVTTTNLNATLDYALDEAGKTVAVNTGAVALGGRLDLSSAGDITVGSGAGTAIDANGSAVRLTADSDADGAGAITDGGGIIDADTAELVLRAGSGIGAAGAAIDTANVTTLAAVTDTGDLRVSNAGGLAIDSVTFKTDTLDGATILDTADTNGAGAIEIAAASPLTIGNAVTNNSGGDITLAASGATAADDLAINADVTTTGGNGSIALYAGDSIAQATGTTISAAGSGTVLARAGSDYNAGTPQNGTDAGAITMTDGAVIDGGSGRIDLAADLDIRVGRLVTTNTSDAAVTLASADGAVIDNGDTGGEDVEATGGRLVVEAVTGVGSGDALETEVGSLDISNVDGATVSAAGNIEIAETDAVAVQNLNNGGTGTIDLTASGTITVSAGGPGITAAGGDVALDANGQNADVAVAATIATSGAGTVSVTADDSVTFAATGGVNASGSGGVTVTANATTTDGDGGDAIAMTDGAVIDAGTGTITLQTTGANSGDITLGRLVTTNATGAAVTLTTGEGAVVDGGDTGGADVSAGGRLVIDADKGIGASNAIETDVASLDADNATSGAIRISEADGLTVIRAVQAAAAGAGTIDITLTGAGAVLDNSLGLIGNSGGSGAITLMADDMSLVGGAIAGGSGVVTLGPNAGGREIDLGTDVAGKLGLTDAELDTVTTTGRIVVGAAGAGNVTFSGLITLSAVGTDTLEVVSGGTVNDTGGATVFMDTSLALDAAGGIGTTSPLNIRVSNLGAEVADGGIRIANIGDLSLTQVGDVTGVSSTGVGTGDIIVTAASSITVDRAVSALGTDGVSLDATTDIDVNAAITTAAGTVDLTADNDVTFAAAGDVTTAGGKVTVRADDDLVADAGAGGAIVMADGAVIDAGSGAVELSADESITLGRLVSGSGSTTAVVLTSRSAGILDGGDTGGEDVEAAGGRLVVDAVTGVGSAGAIETEVASLDIDNVGAGVSGDIRIAETDAVSIQELDNDASGGAIDLTTTNGTITVSAGGFGVNAASGDIGLDAGGQNADVVVDAAVFTAAAGAITIAADDSVLFSAAGDVTGFFGSGDISITANAATTNGDSGDRITMADGTQISTLTGAISLQATGANAGDITLGSLFTSNASAAAVTITTAAAVVDGGDTSTDVLAAGGLVIDAGTGVGAADAIDTSVASLDVDNSTSGAIRIAEANDLAVVRAVQASASGGNAIDITLTGAGATLDNSAGTIGTSGGTGTITLTADDMTLAGGVITGGGRVRLLPNTGGREIDLGTDTAGKLGLTDGDLDTIAAAGVLEIGSAGGGAITVSTDIDPIASGTLHLKSGASIAGGRITVGALALTAGTSIDVTSSVTTLAASAGTGSIAIADLGGFAVGAVDGLAGLTIVDAADANTGAGITVAAASPLTIDEDIVNNDGGDIVLAAEGNTTADDLTINANVTTTGGNGLIKLYAGDGISQAAGSTVRADGSGMVLVRAGTDYNGGAPQNGTDTGAIAMADGAVVNAGSGVIDMAADLAVTLGRLITTSVSTVAVKLASAAGAIVDGGDTGGEDVEATGGRLVIDAATGVGSGNAIETEVASLDVDNTTSGNVEIAETDAVAVQNLNNGGAGTIDLTAGGTITVSAGGSGVAAGGGDITLDANGQNADVAVAAAIVTSGTGAVAVTADDSVTFAAAGDVTASGSGGVTVTANAAAGAGDGGDAITMADGAVIDAGSGTIALQATGAAAGDVTLGGLTTTNASDAAVTIAAAAAVVDGGDADTDVSAMGRLVVDAGTGVGSADAIETDVASLDIDNATSGDIAVAEAGDVALINVAHAGGLRTVTIAAGGAITDGTAGETPLIVADSATLTAATGIGAAGDGDIDTQLATLAAKTTASGDIVIDETDDLVLGAGGSGVSTAGSDISVTTGGALTVAEAVVAGGAGKITFDADGITLDAATMAAGDLVRMISRGGINNGGLVTAGTIDLDAETGIGNAGLVRLAGTTISADTTAGAIAVDNTSAVAVTVTSLTTAGGATVTYGQSGGGSVGFSTVTTTADADPSAGEDDITLTNAGGDLTVDGASVTAAGEGNVVLRTTGAGSVVLTGATTAEGNSVTIEAADAINGSGLVTADSITLAATKGIGAATGLETQAATIEATNAGSGAVVLSNTGVLDFTLDQSGGGSVSVTNDSDLTVTNLVAGGSPVNMTAIGAAFEALDDIGVNTGPPLGSLTITADTISLHDVTTSGGQTYNGQTTFNSTYRTDGSDFRVNGALTLGSTTTIITSGGKVEFNGTVDGSGGGEQDLIIDTNRAGSVFFGEPFGANVPLGVVDLQNVKGFRPIPAGSLVKKLLVPPDDPQFQAISDLNSRIGSQVGNFFILLGGTARIVDLTPGLGLAGSAALLGAISPAAGEDEALEALGLDTGSTFLESCPDVVLTSLAWQNTPSDAVFNVAPEMVPYSVDAYCGGYKVTGAARGAFTAYEIFTFITRDFWTDLRQARQPTPISELRPIFGIPDDEE